MWNQHACSQGRDRIVYDSPNMLQSWAVCSRCRQRCYALDAWGECPSCAWMRQRYYPSQSTSPPTRKDATPETGLFCCAVCDRSVRITPGHPRLYCSGRCRTRAYRKRLEAKHRLSRLIVKPSRGVLPTSENVERASFSRIGGSAVTSQKVPKVGCAPTRMEARVHLGADTYAWARTIAHLTHHTLSELVDRSVRRYVRAIAREWPREYFEHLPTLPRQDCPRRRGRSASADNTSF